MSKIVIFFILLSCLPSQANNTVIIKRSPKHAALLERKFVFIEDKKPQSTVVTASTQALSEKLVKPTSPVKRVLTSKPQVSKKQESGWNDYMEEVEGGEYEESLAVSARIR